jgi:DNA-binding NarL/FixJ family response regulator
LTLGAPAMSRLRVCVVAGNSLAGQYLVDLLARDQRLEVLHDRAAAEAPPTRCPPVVVAEWSSTDLDLTELLRAIRSRHEGHVVVTGPEADAAAVVRYLYLGVHGYVPFREVADQLLPAVYTVMQGGYWMPSLCGADQPARSGTAPSASRPAALTNREQEVLRLVARRHSNKEIAGILCISERTVKFHVSNVLSKLQMHDRTRLIEELVHTTLSA